MHEPEVGDDARRGLLGGLARVRAVGSLRLGKVRLDLLRAVDLESAQVQRR